jgi:hypothetical protein
MTDAVLMAERLEAMNLSVCTEAAALMREQAKKIALGNCPDDALDALQKLVEFAEPALEDHGFCYVGSIHTAKKILAKHGRGPVIGSTGFEEAAAAIAGK